MGYRENQILLANCKLSETRFVSLLHRSKFYKKNLAPLSRFSRKLKWQIDFCNSTAQSYNIFALDVYRVQERFLFFSNSATREMHLRVSRDHNVFYQDLRNVEKLLKSKIRLCQYRTRNAKWQV